MQKRLGLSLVEVEEVEDVEDVDEPKQEPADLEDLFGYQEAPQQLRRVGGLESLETKTWTDDTGKFQCDARLLRTTSSAVVLVKPNGYRATVPMKRLSEADLRFVHQQVVAKRAMLAQRAFLKKVVAN